MALIKCLDSGARVAVTEFCSPQRGLIMARLFVPAAALVLAMASTSALAGGQDAPPRQIRLAQPMPLGRLISVLISPADPDLDWSLGAGSDSSVQWTSNGVETTNCGVYAACRSGKVRVSVDGKELKNLRQKIEPVEWEIFITSTAPAKFPPEKIDLQPHCDTVACEFSLGEELQKASFEIQKICEQSAPQEKVVGYRISNAKQSAFIAYSTGYGSGGTSNSIEILLNKSTSPEVVCKLSS